MHGTGALHGAGAHVVSHGLQGTVSHGTGAHGTYCCSMATGSVCGAGLLNALTLIAVNEPRAKTSDKIFVFIVFCLIKIVCLELKHMGRGNGLPKRREITDEV